MTSTTLAGPAALTRGRRLLLAALFCAGAAWLAGPAARMVVALALLLLAPGYLIERALPRAGHPALVRLALQIGLSLSAIALLYEWCWLVGLALTTLRLQLLAALLALGAGALLWRDLGHSGRRPTTTADLLEADARDQRGRTSAVAISAAAFGPRSAAVIWALFGLVCLATLWTRWAQIEGLALPPWVDSVHHALLVRVAAERGMAPTMLEPAMPIAELPYHWGYHVVMAALMQLSGLDLVRTLLWPGQILNALQAPMAGALALLLWRRPAAALGAALVAGLLSLFPAYYLSWGRYTQLAGLLLVPGLAAASMAALAGGGRRWWAAVALLLAGLFLVHIRVLIFALCLLVALGAIWAARADRSRLRIALIGAAGAGCGALALGAPWIALLTRRLLLPAFARPQTLLSDTSYTALNVSLLWAGNGRWLVALALLGLLWGLWRRQSAALALILWAGLLILLSDLGLLTYLLPAVGAALLSVGLMQRRWPLLGLGALLLLANPWMLRVPVTWLISGDSVVIALFLPIGAALGGAAATLLDDLRRRGPQLRRRAGLALVVATLGLTAWGAWSLRMVVNPGTVIASAADLAAVEWAGANTAPTARFLINPAPWLGIAGRGADGGWWLLPLARRWASVPPVLFTYGPPAYVDETAARTRMLLDYKPGGEEAILELIRRDQIDYLFFGTQPGPLRPELFSALPGMRTVYSQDGVTILAVESQP